MAVSISKSWTWNQQAKEYNNRAVLDLLDYDTEQLAGDPLFEPFRTRPALSVLTQSAFRATSESCGYDQRNGHDPRSRGNLTVGVGTSRLQFHEKGQRAGTHRHETIDLKDEINLERSDLTNRVCCRWL